MSQASPDSITSRPSKRRVSPLPAGPCVAQQAAPRRRHPDAKLLRVAAAIKRNDVREEKALAQLPDPEAYAYLSSSCDPATLAMDQACGRGRTLRDDLAALVATTPEGLQAKAVVVASDTGNDPSHPEEIDWSGFDAFNGLSMSIVRDLVFMGAREAASKREA